MPPEEDQRLQDLLEHARSLGQEGEPATKAPCPAPRQALQPLVCGLLVPCTQGA